MGIHDGLLLRISVLLVQFRGNRSSTIPQAVFATGSLPGTLVVDRDVVYNKASCQIQYCYAHLLRLVQEEISWKEGSINL